MISLWLRGLALGFSIAAPVGPIGVLCIRRTLTDGRLIGFISGLGAASADAFYGAVAAFGLTAVSSALIAERRWIHLLGGIFLCYLGLRTLLRAVASPAASSSIPSLPEAPRPPGLGLLGAYASTLGLTLTNPTTILSFAVIFAGLGVAQGGYSGAGWVVLGVFSGSACWWLILSSVVGLLRTRVTPLALRWVNRVSGAILLVFGLVSLATTFSA
jgi:threonine/homoserine/homoserine lactone efflux protein